jgi:hypothetical protein
MNAKTMTTLIVTIAEIMYEIFGKVKKFESGKDVVPWKDLNHRQKIKFVNFFKLMSLEFIDNLPLEKMNSLIDHANDKESLKEYLINECFPNIDGVVVIDGDCECLENKVETNARNE